jgi:hypothetical protein
VDARHDALAPVIHGLQQHIEQLRADNEQAWRISMHAGCRWSTARSRRSRS